MLLPRSLVLVIPTILDVVSAANIFVSHFSGSIVTLNLAQQGNGYSLTQSSSLSVGGQPSWMTYNSTTRKLYISDETSFGSYYLLELNAATNGALSQAGKANSPVYGSVASGLYGDGKFIASAHYSPSSITTFKLPLSSSSQAIQNIKLTMPNRGPNQRQDVPHPHSAFTDPTGDYLLVPDLGADQIRIYSINRDTGFLTACASGITAPGSGPRHGVFNGDILYIANELSNTVDSFSVIYPASGCLQLTRQQTLTTRPNNATLPSGTKVAEVRLINTSLYVSNRRDGLFSGNDSIAHFEVDCPGTMSFKEISNSYGTYPRTFQVNKAGDLVVIGDQTTANVVVVKRDTGSGVLGDVVANMRILAAGTPENENGISAVLWDE